MIGAGTVTSLTLYTRLRRFDFEFRSKFEGSGRVALKAAQYCRAGVEGAIPLTGIRSMAGSRRHRLCLSVVAQSLLDVVIAIQLTDERDCLRARAKGPIGGI